MHVARKEYSRANFEYIKVIKINQKKYRPVLI